MPEPAGELWQDLTYASFDDLRLHVRHYKAPAAKSRSVICLPGLTRNSRDFHTLATFLSRYAEKPRDVYCFDYRGAARPQYARHWRNYVPYIELLDTLDFLTINGLHKVGIVGTSRGGIVAMLMAALRPTAMGPVVLNDIGAVIETRGLARIINYVRRIANPKSWPDAIMIVREINERAFPNLTDAEWEEMARAIFDERKGRPVRAYDRRLSRARGGIDLRRSVSRAVAAINLSRPVPDLWPQFIALGQVPALVIRGANSDVLSAETLEAMIERHPNLRKTTVPDQGPAPLPKDHDTVEAIASCFAANDYASR